MLKNWYIAIFAILLAGAGVGFVPFSVPNQEIVVQFSQEISDDDTEAAIAKVRTQLTKLGVADVQVVQRADGSLKISYYSEIDVSSIQEIFAKQQSGLFNNTSHENSDIPFKEHTDVYQFTVSEIGSDSNADNGLNGLVFEVETKSNRFYPPDFTYATASNTTEKELKLDELSVCIYSKQAICITISSHLLPETRAGPLV